MTRVGVDVGGTFTDIVVFEETSGEIRVLKVPTTPARPVEGIMDGLNAALGTLTGVTVLVHSTTIGTNMLLGQVGLEPPEAVLFTNEGFRDILEIGRQNRPSLYNPFYTRPRPLIPRSHRVGVKGRIDGDGVEVEPLDVEVVKSEASKWCSRGVRVFIVSLLHSYLNPRHEVEAGEAIRGACPDADVVLSHEVDPQPMEYERTSTAVVNGLLKPVLSRYLEELARELSARGFKGLFLAMQSSGGVSGLKEALETPAAFIESGPSAGAVAVAYLARLLGIGKALGFDMGGTTAKASSIVNGDPEIVEAFEVGGSIHTGRLVRGSGYPVRYPHIDLAEVSAGGGTIAWVDRGGALRVGPESAGADPGPACYGRGGVMPTITDANLLLGRLPARLAGGVELKSDLAERALRERVAAPLGMDVVDAAWAIIGLANTVMARALRLVSVERGRDPREFTLVAFGGAGPLHAAELAEELSIPRIIVPPHAGVYSALGLLAADYKHSLHTAIVKPAEKIRGEELEEAFQRMEERAHRLLDSEGVPLEGRRFTRLLEARYWGQGYTLRVPFRGSVEEAVEDFHHLHAARYGFSNPDESVVIVVARLEAYGLTVKPKLAAPRGVGDPVKGERMIFYRGGWVESTVYSREALAPGRVVEGPAVVEARDTTILVPPGFKGVVDPIGSLVIGG